jgi:hypothetical protein
LDGSKRIGYFPFATEADYRAYVQSDAFRRNPRGMAIDPDEFVAKFRSGMPQEELVRIS